MFLFPTYNIVLKTKGKEKNMAKQNLQKQNIKNRQKKSKKKNQALQELDALETALVNNWIDDSSDFYIQEEETSIPQSANEVETLLQESSQQEMEISKPNRPQPKKRKQRSRRKPKRSSSPSSKRKSTYPALKLVGSTNIPQSQRHFITKWTEEEKSPNEETGYSGVPSYYEESGSRSVALEARESDEFYPDFPHHVAQFICTMPGVFGLTDQHLQPLSELTRHLQDFLITEKKIDEQMESNKTDVSIIEDKQANNIQSNHSQVSLVPTPNQLETIKLQQVGKESFTLQQGRVRTKLTIDLTEPFQEMKYVFMATTNVPFCFAVVEKKESNRVTIEIIRQIANREISGQVEWIAVGEKVENQVVQDIG
ncbi:WIAG-tail domain [Brevibacillus laterosporus]|nr:WIAG-tail domain [Brevibacillus laterosporus]